ncbi:MAG: type II secretion system F family protein [Acidimicrobiales bacterium]
MRQPLAISLLCAWLGLTLVLANVRWFRRRPLVDRIRPYLFGLSVAKAEDQNKSPLERLLGPLAHDIGASVAKFSGVHEELTIRLNRIHSPMDATAFRLRQLGWVIASSVVAAAVALAARPSLPIALLFIVGAPVLTFLIIEAQLSRRSNQWKRSLVLELPIVSEQLGMLLSAGYSLGAALQRLSNRSEGTTSRDLRRVVGRVKHGIDDNAALQEWAASADVSAVGRLVAVLALNRDAGDLGHLITNEARAVRAEVHRELVEVIEKRGQQVWIPVTVATLVPGLLFLAVPFTEALRLFTST